MKSYALIVEPDSAKEIQRIIDYYESKQLGLGEDFANLFDEALVSLGLRPYVHTLRYGDVRFAVIKPFKEAVHYSVDEASRTVYVLGVISQRRDPGSTWNRGQG